MTLGQHEQERRQGGLGIMKKWILRLCIIFGVIFVTHLVTKCICRVLPIYESALHKSSMMMMQAYLEDGDTGVVFAAIATYNEVAATGTTYEAVSEMENLLAYPTTNSPQQGARAYPPPAARLLRGKSRATGSGSAQP
jgi:hypothetical protein